MGRHLDQKPINRVYVNDINTDWLYYEIGSDCGENDYDQVK